MEKYVASLIVLISFFFAITVARAAVPSVELKVKGTVGVPSCNVIAPDDGVYDLGEIMSIQIKSGVATTALTPIKKNWTIICDAITYLTFTPQDNRKESASTVGNVNFGLGFINDTGKMGYYNVIMDNAKVDNVSSNIVCIQPGMSPSCTTDSILISGEVQGWSHTDRTLKAGKTFSADFEVLAILAGTSTMKGPVTEDTKLDGSMTMSFAFGI